MPGYYAPNGRFEGTLNGDPLVGGRLFTYVAGTTTPAVTYQNTALSTPNTNPVILDAQGRAVVVLDDSVTYDFVLQAADGSSVWTADTIVSPTAGIAAEAASRLAGDTANAASIVAETASRVASVNAETAARTTAINAEATARSSADTNLQNQITALSGVGSVSLYRSTFVVPGLVAGAGAYTTTPKAYPTGHIQDRIIPIAILDTRFIIPICNPDGSGAANPFFQNVSGATIGPVSVTVEYAVFRRTTDLTVV